jgi:hypothetical protein
MIFPPIPTVDFCFEKRKVSLGTPLMSRAMNPPSEERPLIGAGSPRTETARAAGVPAGPTPTPAGAATRVLVTKRSRSSSSSSSESESRAAARTAAGSGRGRLDLRAGPLFTASSSRQQSEIHVPVRAAGGGMAQTGSRTGPVASSGSDSGSDAESDVELPDDTDHVQDVAEYRAWAARHAARLNAANAANVSRRPK